MRRSREFEIIERWLDRPPRDDAVLLGIGDDAAVVEASGRLAIAVDSLVEGTHFPEGTPAHALGHRVLAVNLSDLAAMGARPRWATLALSLPDGDSDWVAEFSDGFFGLAERFSVDLIGGDTVRGPLSATVQVIGECIAEPLLRSGGREGDLIFVSGSIGDSAAGLACLQEQTELQRNATRSLIDRFRYPEPRVDLGLRLSGFAHAAIDISDGLAVDLGRLCAQSGCGADILLDSLPLSESLTSRIPGMAAVDFALHGGDDYELCFSAAEQDRNRVEEMASAVGTQVSEIGVLTAGTDIVTVSRDGTRTKLAPAGFEHFAA